MLHVQLARLDNCFHCLDCAPASLDCYALDVDRSETDEAPEYPCLRSFAKL